MVVNFWMKAVTMATSHLMTGRYIPHFGLNSLISTLSFGENFSYFATSWKRCFYFLVRSASQTSEQPRKCARARCKTYPFICNVEKLSRPKRSIKITDHFTCTPANVIFSITCTLCKKLYIGETSRRLGDRFREHLRYVEKD